MAETLKRTHSEMVADDHIKTEDTTGDSDVQSDDGKVPAYDAKQEKLPSSVVFTPEFAALTDVIHEQIELLSKPIEETSYRNGVVNGLLEEIKLRTKAEFPEEVRIALIGDMSSGKSSVINSILSVGTIARQGDAGGSCTWVVQEFCYTLPKQTQPFAAEIHFFNQEERYSIIKSLFADYYRASTRDDDAADGPKDSDQTVDEFNVREGCITAFRALFSGQKVFATRISTQNFLDSAQSEDDDRILDRLSDYSDCLMNTLTSRGPTVLEQASTCQTLTWEILPYLTTVEQRDGEPIPSPWPFVSYIKFGLDHDLLKHGITLVDLPGLSDANRIRVANAMHHLRLCTHYMIVAEIGRIKDNKFVRDHMLRGSMTRGSGRVILVLTHADTIDDDTEVEATRKEQQQLDGLLKEMKGFDLEKSQLISKMKTVKGTQKYQLMEEKDGISARLRASSSKHTELRIAIRSRNIATEMQQLYATLTPDPIPLAIFCVGNQAYKKHQAGYATDDPGAPTLSVEGTKIPALRRHLFLAPAEGRLNEVRHLVSAQLPSLLGCFNLYVSKTHMARKDEVERFVLEPQETAPVKIKEHFMILHDEAEKYILTPWREDSFDWTTEARDMCRQWEKMYSTSTHLQFLKRDGIRKGKGKGAAPISWNEDLLQINASEVRRWFKNYESAQDQAPKQIVKDIHKLVNMMDNKIKSTSMLPHPISIC